MLHSAVTERERFDAWRRAYRGEARLVVGTRSAVFAPLPSPGLIIVDEEHDASYKQQRGLSLLGARPRRRPRAALERSRRARLRDAVARNIQQRRTGPLPRSSSLPRRIGSAGVPKVRVVDLNRHASRQALSTPLDRRHRPAPHGRQSSVAVLESPRLRARVVLPELQSRRAMPALRRTHDRAREIRLPCAAIIAARNARSSSACRTCGSERIAVGAGTQRVGDELAALFPAARIARLDRDSTSRKGSLAAVLDDVESGNVEILIGTQMLTKGHDFPRVTLVGVLNADQGLFGTDPRSHERLAQTILQVAGRAGRADRPGEVVIQTHYPDHPLLKCLLASDYTAFATLALVERREAALAAVRAPRRMARGSDAPRCRVRVARAACAASRRASEQTRR